MKLSEEERERFVEFLTQEAHSTELLSEQTEKLLGEDSILTKRLKQEALAYKFVANKIAAWEEMNISSKE